MFLSTGGVMDPCSSNPCQNSGECTSSFVDGSVAGNRTAEDVTFSCSCTADFTGDQCGTPLDRG